MSSPRPPSAAPIHIQSYIDLILSSKDTSGWLKAALQSALDRDCIDAYHDAKLLLEVLSRISHRTTPTLGD